MPFNITEELGWWCTPLFLAVGRLMWESRNFEPKLGSIMRPCYKTKRESVGLVSKILQTELTLEFCHLYNAPAPASLAIGAFYFFSPTQNQFPWTCVLPPRIFILTFSLFVLEKSHSCTSEKPLGRGLQNDFGLEKLQTWVGLKIRCWLVPGTWVLMRRWQSQTSIVECTSYLPSKDWCKLRNLQAFARWPQVLHQ